jgi:MFS family permease
MEGVMSAYYLAAPLLMIELKASPIELGLFGSIASAVQMMLAHRMGPLSDRFGRRRLILLGPLLFAFSCVLAAMVNRVWAVLMLSALNGFCLSLFWPSMQAWVAEFPKEAGLARNIGTLNMAWTASLLLGPALSGVFFGLHPRLPFLLAGCLALGLFLLSHGSIHDRPAGHKTAEADAEGTLSSWHRKFLHASWIANFISWFMMGNARFQFPKLARELGSSPQAVGLLMGCLGLFLFLGFFLLREVDLWHFRRRYLFGAQALAAAGLSVLSVSDSAFLFALALMAIGLSASVTYYSSLFYAVRLSPQIGKGTGFHESVLSTGALAGPLLGGLGATFSGLRAPYLICLLFLAAAVGCEAALLRRKEPPDRTQSKLKTD